MSNLNKYNRLSYYNLRCEAENVIKETIENFYKTSKENNLTIKEIRDKIIERDDSFQEMFQEKLDNYYDWFCFYNNAANYLEENYEDVNKIVIEGNINILDACYLDMCDFFDDELDKLPEDELNEALIEAAGLKVYDKSAAKELDIPADVNVQIENGIKAEAEKKEEMELDF